MKKKKRRGKGKKGKKENREKKKAGSELSMKPVQAATAAQGNIPGSNGGLRFRRAF